MPGLNCHLCTLALLLAVLSSPVAAASSARSEVEKGISDSLAVLRDKSLPRPARNYKLTALLDDGFDFDTLSRLSLGQTWRDLTDAQKAEFTQEFRKHVLAICRQGADQYTNQDMTIAADKAESNGDWTVQTKIIGIKNGAPREVAHVDFRLRPKAGQWKVIDVTIGGVSLAAGFRAQLAVIMKEGGIDRVLQLLREKNAAAEKPAPAK